MRPDDTPRDGTPEPAADPVPDSLHTGELGSEGGSYGELAQSVRAARPDVHPRPDMPASRGRSVAPAWILMSVPAVLIIAWFLTSAMAC